MLMPRHGKTRAMSLLRLLLNIPLLHFRLMEGDGVGRETLKSRGLAYRGSGWFADPTRLVVTNYAFPKGSHQSHG
jgi:hypothetical protein